MMNRPFVQVFYDLKDHWIFTTEDKPEYTKAFMLMVLRANHTTSHRIIAGKRYAINPGELFFNAETFGKESGLGSKSTVSRFISLLQDDGIVEKLHKHKEPTRLKICNFVNFSGNYTGTKKVLNGTHYNKENNDINIYKCIHCDFTKTDSYESNLSTYCTNKKHIEPMQLIQKKEEIPLSY
jgi:hypothetical protein